MASSQGAVSGTAHRIPIIEVIDLESDDETVDYAVQKFAQRDSAEVSKEEGQDSDGDQWESESFYEDALEGMGDEQLADGGTAHIELLPNNSV